MSTEENKGIARRYGEDIWDKGNLAAADELLDTNLIDHQAQALLTSVAHRNWPRSGA